MIVVRNIDELYAFLTKSTHIINISTGTDSTYVYLDRDSRDRDSRDRDSRYQDSRDRDTYTFIHIYVTTPIDTVKNEIIKRAPDYDCKVTKTVFSYEIIITYKYTYRAIIEFTRHKLPVRSNLNIILDMRGAICDDITYIIDFNFNYFKQYAGMRIINIPIRRCSVSACDIPTPDRIMSCLLVGKDRLPSNVNQPVSNLKAANHIMPGACPQCNAYFMKTYEYRTDGARVTCCCLCPYSINITHYRKVSYKKILNDIGMTVIKKHKNSTLLMELGELFDRNSNACLNPTYVDSRIVYCNKIAIVEYGTMLDLNGFNREIDTIIIMLDSFMR